MSSKQNPHDRANGRFASRGHLCSTPIATFGFPFIAACFLSFQAYGQEGWEKEGAGEIKDVQYEIIVNKKITLSRAARNFEKIPPRPFEPIKPAIAYESKNFRFTTPDYKSVIRPLKLKQEELSKVYGNYLSAGFGNYASFFLEGSVTTKRDKNKFLGAHVYNRSFGKGPVAEKNSAASTLQVQLFGKSMGKDVTLSGEANVESRGAYFYGYNPVVEVDRNRIRQLYNVYSLNAGIENTKVSDLNYSLKGGFSYLRDHYNASESEVSLLFNSTYKINQTSKFLLNANYFLITRKDSLFNGTPRHLLMIKPSYQFTPIENLLVTAGLNVALQNDQYAGSKDIHVYPNVKAQYSLSPSMELYGIVTGDIDKVNLHTLSAENLWVNSNIPIYHTNRALEFRGGLTGKIGRKVAVGAGFSLAALKNYYYYLNVRDNFNPAGSLVGAPVDKFNVVYDRDTKRLNPFAEISYAHAEMFNLALRGDYFSYATDVLPEAWHRPTYRVSATSRLNLYDKISLEAGFIAQGGMKALDPVSNLTVSLDPAFDLNMKARYFLSKQFSAFVQMSNMLSNKYPIYLSYPARGFQVLGGVSLSF